CVVDRVEDRVLRPAWQRRGAGVEGTDERAEGAKLGHCSVLRCLPACVVALDPFPPCPAFCGPSACRCGLLALLPFVEMALGVGANFQSSFQLVGHRLSSLRGCRRPAGAADTTMTSLTPFPLLRAKAMGSTL